MWSDCCEFEVFCIDLQSVEICVISVTAVSRKELCGIGPTYLLGELVGCCNIPPEVQTMLHSYC